VVDEVLAVGDAEFQKKCLGKMEDVSKNEGRTVLFVSHNMGAVKMLCNRSIVLFKGTKILEGDVIDSLSKYLSFGEFNPNTDKKYTRDKTLIGKSIYIKEVILDDNIDLDFFRLKIDVKIFSKIFSKVSINISLKDGLGFPVAAGFIHYFEPNLLIIEPGINEFTIITSRINLALGKYKLNLELVLPGVESLDFLEEFIQFELSNDNISNRSLGIDQNWGLGSTEILFQQIIKK
jgi:lipopolysaccharide transport system ATP-binding protein